MGLAEKAHLQGGEERRLPTPTLAPPPASRLTLPQAEYLLAEGEGAAPVGLLCGLRFNHFNRAEARAQGCQGPAQLTGERVDLVGLSPPPGPGWRCR